MANLRAKDDVVFKMVFGQQKNEKLLISLLNAILDLPIEKKITSVKMVGNCTLDKCFTNDKISILDIKAIDSNHSRINIEIQLKNEYNMDKRTLFYWSKLYNEQIKRGDLYAKLRKSITINILNFKYLETSNFHSVFHLCEDTNKKIQFDDIEMHFLELPKFRKLMPNYKCSLNNWLLFIDGWSEEEKSMAKKENPIFELAEEALDYVTSSEEAQYYHEQFQKRIRDEKNNLYGARQEGEAKGLAKGKAENKLEIAKKMLAKGYNISEICDITGLEEKDFH